MILERFKMNAAKTRKNQGGFSLVELAVALTAIGLLMGGTLFIVKTTQHQLSIKDTRAKMEKIADHLSNYAQLHDRLPCPASPFRQNKSDVSGTQAVHFGDERVYTAANVTDIEQAADCYDNGVDSHGIVPYRALGLDENYARDAWGRYFTYVVSPVSARYNYINAADTTINRNVEHYVSTSTQRNSLTPKYRFCHGMPNTPDAVGGANVTLDDSDDFQYNNLPAASFAYRRDSAPETVMAANNPDIAFSNDYQAGGADPHPHTRRVAFALISHGTNGLGSYFGNETANKFDNGALAGRPSEQANAAEPAPLNPNNILSLEFADGPTAAAAQLFDDIVMVKTQDQIFGRIGGQSCVTP